jgi:hypothetical protein
MQMTIVWLLVGFVGGIYCREFLAQSQAAEAARRAKALDQQNVALRLENTAMRDAEARRLDQAARGKRYREENDLSDSENQIKFISQTKLHAVRPVNKEAVRVLYAVDEWIAANRPDWRVSFEVSMGAFIKTANDPEDRIDRAAFSSYNSKRVDFLLIDRFGYPMLVAEYHGSGHDMSDDAEDRMTVKRLALDRARIPLVEIPSKATKSDILRMIAEKLSDNASSAPPRPSSRLTIQSRLALILSNPNQTYLCEGMWLIGPKLRNW